MLFNECPFLPHLKLGEVSFPNGFLPCQGSLPFTLESELVYFNWAEEPLWMCRRRRGKKVSGAKSLSLDSLSLQTVGFTDSVKKKEEVFGDIWGHLSAASSVWLFTLDFFSVDVVFKPSFLLPCVFLSTLRQR